MSVDDFSPTCGERGPVLRGWGGSCLWQAGGGYVPPPPLPAFSTVDMEFRNFKKPETFYLHTILVQKTFCVHFKMGI